MSIQVLVFLAIWNAFCTSQALFSKPSNRNSENRYRNPDLPNQSMILQFFLLFCYWRWSSLKGKWFMNCLVNPELKSRFQTYSERYFLDLISWFLEHIRTSQKRRDSKQSSLHENREMSETLWSRSYLTKASSNTSRRKSTCSTIYSTTWQLDVTPLT